MKIPTFTLTGEAHLMMVFKDETPNPCYLAWLRYIKNKEDLPPIKPASEVTPIFYSAS